MAISFKCAKPIPIDYAFPVSIVRKATKCVS
jgi:hypothetical protein